MTAPPDPTPTPDPARPSAPAGDRSKGAREFEQTQRVRRVGNRLLTEAELAAHLERQRTNRRRKRLEPPPTLESSLGPALKALKLDGPLKRRRLHQAWAAALGHDPVELRRTRIVRLARGVLTIEVDSAGTAAEYKRFFKTAILESLAESLQGRPHIVDLVVRVGTFPVEGEDPSLGVDVA